MMSDMQAMLMGFPSVEIKNQEKKNARVKNSTASDSRVNFKIL